MASVTFIHPCSSHTSSPSHTVSKSFPCFAFISTSPVSYTKKPIFCSLTVALQLGLASLSTWNGHRSNGVSISLKSLTFVSREFKSTLEKEIGLDELKNPSQLNTLSAIPLSVATPEKSQTETPTSEDSQTTTTVLAATEDSEATPSQATEPPVAAATANSQGVTTTPVAPTTTNPNSVQEITVGSEVGTLV